MCATCRRLWRPGKGRSECVARVGRRDMREGMADTIVCRRRFRIGCHVQQKYWTVDKQCVPVFASFACLFVARSISQNIITFQVITRIHTHHFCARLCNSGFARRYHKSEACSFLSHDFFPLPRTCNESHRKS